MVATSARLSALTTIIPSLGFGGGGSRLRRWRLSGPPKIPPDEEGSFVGTVRGWQSPTVGTRHAFLSITSQSFLSNHEVRNRGPQNSPGDRRAVSPKGGFGECALVTVFVLGQHANVPSFRFSFRGNIRMYPRSGFRSGGTSAKTTLLETNLLGSSENRVGRGVQKCLS